MTKKRIVFFSLKVVFVTTMLALTLVLVKSRAADRSLLNFKTQANMPISTIIQTGTHRESLKSSLLAELLDLSVDQSILLSSFNTKEYEETIKKLPLIKDVSLEKIKPDGILVEYTMRHPKAMLYDYENIAVDEMGYLFPFTPYFSPKNLPSIFLGMLPFEKHSEDPAVPCGEWGVSIKSPLFDLAIDLLDAFSSKAKNFGVFVELVDVSKAFSESYGRRELVLKLRHIEPDIIHYLRVNPTHYPKQLGNYFSLLEKGAGTPFQAMFTEDLGCQYVVDLRLEGSAYIQPLEPNAN